MISKVLSGRAQAPDRLAALDELVARELSNGADVSSLDEDGHTPLLVVSSQAGTASTVERLLDAKADVNERDGRGASVLCWACSFSGDARNVRLLLDARADLHASDDDGLTPLMGASMFGHQSVVRLLLEARVSPDCDGESIGSRAGSAVALAGEFGHVEVLQILLSAAASGAAA